MADDKEKINIFKACKKGNIEQVKQWLADDKSDARISKEDGATPLSIAALANKWDIVKLFLDVGYAVQADRAGKDHPSAVALAVYQGLDDVVHRLFTESDADPHGLTPPGDSLLWVAANRGHVNLSRILIHLGVDPTFTRPGGTSPLDEAKRSGSQECIDIITGAISEWRVAAAAGSGDYKTLKRLVAELGVEYRREHIWNYATALCIAAAQGQDKTVKKLLDMGASVTATDASGANALFLGAAAGKPDIIKRLVQAGAPVDAPGTDGMTPLYASAMNGHAEAVLALLEAGANVDQTVDSKTPLFVATEHRHDEVVARLLEKAASPDIGDETGITPLCLSLYPLNIPVMKLLLQHNADPNGGQRCPVPPLYLAARGGADEAVKCLLDRGADPNKVCDEDNTMALHQAALHNHVSIIRMLLAAGANPRATTPQGKTAIVVAQEAGHTACVEVLSKEPERRPASEPAAKTTPESRRPVDISRATATATAPSPEQPRPSAKSVSIAPVPITRNDEPPMGKRTEDAAPASSKHSPIGVKRTPSSPAAAPVAPSSVSSPAPTAAAPTPAPAPAASEPEPRRAAAASQPAPARGRATETPERKPEPVSTTQSTRTASDSSPAASSNTTASKAPAKAAAKPPASSLLSPASAKSSRPRSDRPRVKKPDVTHIESEEDKLRRIFDRFDKDQTGALDEEEVMDLLRAMGHNPSQSVVRSFIRKLDKDGNGVLSLQEIRSVLTKMPAPPKDEEYARVARLFDLDGNGFVDEHELQTKLSTIGEPLTMDEVAEILEQCEKDARGRVTVAALAKVIATW